MGSSVVKRDIHIWQHVNVDQYENTARTLVSAQTLRITLDRNMYLRRERDDDRLEDSGYIDNMVQNGIVPPPSQREKVWRNAPLDYFGWTARGLFRKGHPRVRPFMRIIVTLKAD